MPTKDTGKRVKGYDGPPEGDQPFHVFIVKDGRACGGTGYTDAEVLAGFQYEVEARAWVEQVTMAAQRGNENPYPCACYRCRVSPKRADDQQMAPLENPVWLWDYWPGYGFVR